MDVGNIIASGEVSQRSITLPSRIAAAAESGRSVVRIFGKGLNQPLRINDSARLCVPRVRDLGFVLCILRRI